MMLAHPVILLRVNEPEVVNATESHDAAVLDGARWKRKGVSNTSQSAEHVYNMTENNVSNKHLLHNNYFHLILSKYRMMTMLLKWNNLAKCNSSKRNRETSSDSHLQNGGLVNALPVDEGVGVPGARSDRDNALRVGDDAMARLDVRPEQLQRLAARVGAAVRAYFSYVQVQLVLAARPAQLLPVCWKSRNFNL